ncbi:MAG TPA: hypothetical protein ENG95_00210 [Nitrospirae bacterium]|nr:hypothetical protein [Nitrospirota bacterium]
MGTLRGVQYVAERFIEKTCWRSISRFSSFSSYADAREVAATGFEVIRANDVGVGIKLLLIISLLCAIGVFLFKKVLESYYAGGSGIGGLLGAYTVARQIFPVQRRKSFIRALNIT